MLWQIQGDARQIPLRDESVQCVVTSPPYWGLRDYKVDGQLGLERTPEEYVSKIVEVFREVRRVMRKDGTLWLNIGDCYASNWGMGAKRDSSWWSPASGDLEGKGWGEVETVIPPNSFKKGRSDGIKVKDLIGIPWRVAFALQADGWYLRSDIIWAKPNPMPESVTDRPTRSHEYLFLLTKSARYFYNANAIREPHQDKNGLDRFVNGCGIGERHNTQGWSGGQVVLDKHREYNPLGRNCRSVWMIPTQPTPAAHFATFPEALVRPCVLAGSRTGDLILDPFAGTGTVGKVALESGRKAVMVDLNYDYLRLDPQKRQPQIGMGL